MVAGAVGAACACLLVIAPTASADRLLASQALRIDSRVVSVSYLRHWLRVAMRGSDEGELTLADARTIDDCAARMTRPPVLAQPDAVRAGCLRRYRSELGQAVEFLVQAAWLELEARDRRIRVSAAEVTRSFLSQKRESFKTEADYQKFLHDSGMTQADVMLRVRLDLLSQRIRKSVPPSQLAAFVKGFFAKWKPRTTCGSQYFVSDVCGRRG